MSAAALRARRGARAERRALRPARAGSGRGRALLRTAFWAGLLAGSLALVVWRQSEASAAADALSAVRADVAVAEAERMELVNRIQQLQSRARVVRDARDRLGLHLPADAEIVLLPLPDGGVDDEDPEGEP